MCAADRSKYMHVFSVTLPLMSETYPLCLFSSNYAVATVSLGFDAPDDQKAHTTKTLLVLNTHQWQLSNPPAGSNSPQSVKHQNWRAFTVKHLKLLETGCAWHMLPKWQGLLITQEVRQRECGAESLISLSVFVVAQCKGNRRNSLTVVLLIILMLINKNIFTGGGRTIKTVHVVSLFSLSPYPLHIYPWHHSKPASSTWTNLESKDRLIHRLKYRVFLYWYRHRLIREHMSA